MTREEIDRYATDFVRVATMALAPQLTSEHGPLKAKQLPEAQSRLRRGIDAALHSLVSQAYEEAARVADAACKEQDEWAERESLPPDYGGDPTIAERIRALKDELITPAARPA